MPTALRPRMTPQERIRAAKSLFKRANDKPGLTQAQRKELRRVASNLVALNMIEPKRHLLPKRPPSLQRRPSAPKE